eukprot:2447467-Pleurochrysis_carterae.AAC.4
MPLPRKGRSTAYKTEMDAIYWVREKLQNVKDYTREIADKIPDLLSFIKKYKPFAEIGIFANLREQAKVRTDFSMEDTIFGGWLNLNPTAQFFAGIVTSHREAVNSRAAGFALQKNQDECMQRLTSQANKAFSPCLRADAQDFLIVPPGDTVVFPQGLIHMAARSEPKSKTTGRGANDGIARGSCSVCARRKPTGASTTTAPSTCGSLGSSVKCKSSERRT